ncbi:MAG: O-antigen translocase, partial [Muribaculaceae bacterium]|nr:O-antigen translocase [Muribaculaceae bacterium]
MGATGINSRILKATTIFGGVQGANIICSVLRTKLVAIWIGAAGIGLFGLLNAAIMLLFTLTQLGLRQSAVRDLAQAPSHRVPATVCAVRRWGLWLGLAGALITIAGSPWLSLATFGSYGNWWMFAALSATVLLSSLNNAESAVLQGLQQLRKLASCSMAGNIGGLAISIPIIYIWRIDGIVPVLIAYYACAWLALGLYRAKVPRPDTTQTVGETIAIGRKFITLGIYITVTNLTANFVSFILISYFNKVGT